MCFWEKVCIVAVDSNMNIGACYGFFSSFYMFKLFVLIPSYKMWSSEGKEEDVLFTPCRFFSCAEGELPPLYGIRLKGKKEQFELVQGIGPRMLSVDQSRGRRVIQGDLKKSVVSLSLSPFCPRSDSLNETCKMKEWIECASARWVAESDFHNVCLQEAPLWKHYAQGHPATDL
uniref:Uncharacterized protein n=1 Tax=Palpitomonas bilix TaxID=652834 RepID=A0A7S3CXN2_9EUKA|mmetsp:Transcript_12328/g.33050  ORF Transcript_12328/g.33050 Transcript_12328/m.33050 type:complete len:174 (+) Transcript_12328:409-930(+)